jgi:hypothetical protein
VTVLPRQPTTYTLRAANMVGSVEQSLTVNGQSFGAASIVQFSVSPSQAPAGTPRVLSWKIHDGIKMVLIGGTLDRRAITDTGSFTDSPLQTTSYQVTASSSPGFTPTEASAQVVARVVPPTAIASFAANPQAIQQGEASTLSWDGSALSWSLASNGATALLGTARSLVVRPSATTTYTLTGSGPGGTAAQDVTVTVTARPATTLSYAPRAVTTEKLRLVADACPAPCTALTLRLQAAAPVSLRGVALDLPSDSTRLALDPASFATAFDAGKAVLGSALLHDTLVVGAALKGSGGTPAADTPLAAGAELAHFSVSLQAAGGPGVVFDGAQAFTSFIQSASGRTPGGIAVGRLEAQ